MDEPLKFEVCLDSDFSSSDQVCIQVYHLGHLCFRQEKTAEGRLPFQYRRPPSGSVAMEGFLGAGRTGKRGPDHFPEIYSL